MEIKLTAFVGEKTPTKAGFLQILKREKWNTNKDEKKNVVKRKIIIQ